ncbi:MAG TPA: hypothetical protein VGD64_06760 [Acidisarcina sp.]
MKSLTLVALLLTTTLGAEAQIKQTPYLSNGELTHTGKTIKLTVSSPRPMEQAVSTIRQEYGLILDYEEGAPPKSRKPRSAPYGPDPRGGAYIIRIPELPSTDLKEEIRFLNRMLREFAKQGLRGFSIFPAPNHGLTIAPSRKSQRFLDTPIAIERRKRTFNETIETILSELSRDTGPEIGRGGIVTGIDQANVLVGGPIPTPAREFLAQALDAVASEQFWILNWDPGMNAYGIAIQTVVSRGQVALQLTLVRASERSGHSR